ncbi:16S rRNA (cytidine(1402)-2'-O)-methyltransferase [Chlamydiales bacterium]|nr:16S rRNA (cytidine(1402)-2'-O)-methyltransferase [Chlamydiales bacterium]
MTLFLVSTPIGNLNDISLRAVETLKQSDYLLCEDTRVSGKLLHHLGFKKPLKSFHKFSEAKNEEQIISDLKKGLTISLLSDAGTPLICDPGERLVRECHLNKIKVEAIPGPCALIQALVTSGWSASPFQFLGFMPRKPGAFGKLLLTIKTFPGTSIVYETKFRLIKTLEWTLEVDPDIHVGVARELTKMYEEFVEGSPQELITYFSKKLPKGEFVLLFKPCM